MFSDDLLREAELLLERYRRRGLRLTTVESCTGGLISGLLTEIAGSSDVLERAFVTYSNEAKEQMVGVPREILASHGAVSAEAAEAMAAGALLRCPADVAVAVTGIAGPGGATEHKPVGLVYLGVCARGGAVRHVREIFTGNRQGVRLASLRRALVLLAEEAR